MQKILTVGVSLVNILILPSIITVDVLTMLSTIVLYGAKKAVSLLGMFTAMNLPNTKFPNVPNFLFPYKTIKFAPF